jgi:hypothetical protein
LAIPVLSATVFALEEPADTTQVDTAVVVDSVAAPTSVDTLLFVPDRTISRAADVANPADLEKHLTQPPTLALFKSLLVPGLGQLGNHKYFKAALFGGLESVFIVAAIHYEQQAHDARELYTAAVDQNTRRVWYYFFDNKRKNRNKYIWFAGLTVFVSMFDAYVDAHLSGSPADSRNDRFTLDVLPNDGGGISAAIGYNF